MKEMKQKKNKEKNVKMQCFDFEKYEKIAEYIDVDFEGLKISWPTEAM